MSKHSNTLTVTCSRCKHAEVKDVTGEQFVPTTFVCVCCGGLCKVTRDQHCDHRNWEVTDDCKIGCGYCRDCGGYPGLASLFDNLRKRIESSLKAFETATEIHKEP